MQFNIFTHIPDYVLMKKPAANCECFAIECLKIFKCPGSGINCDFVSDVTEHFLISVSIAWPDMLLLVTNKSHRHTGNKICLPQSHPYD